MQMSARHVMLIESKALLEQAVGATVASRELLEFRWSQGQYGVTKAPFTRILVPQL
jgi:hypothetical protein